MFLYAQKKRLEFRASYVFNLDVQITLQQLEQFQPSCT